MRHMCCVNHQNKHFTVENSYSTSHINNEHQRVSKTAAHE